MRRKRDNKLERRRKKDTKKKERTNNNESNNNKGKTKDRSERKIRNRKRNIMINISGKQAIKSKQQQIIFNSR